MSFDLNVVEQRRVLTAENVPAQAGQVFTPRGAAVLAASLLDLPCTGEIRVLDPGAGTGSLSAALVSRIRAAQPDTVADLVAVERDKRLLPALQQTLDEAVSLGGVRAVAVEADYLLDGAGMTEGRKELEGPASPDALTAAVESMRRQSRT